eukprot:2990967-Rhodomonas_salina.1
MSHTAVPLLCQVTFDARKVQKSPYIAHTEAMLVPLFATRPWFFQQPDWHFPLGLYCWQDHAEELCTNFATLAEEMQGLIENPYITIAGKVVKIKLFLPSD